MVPLLPTAHDGRARHPVGSYDDLAVGAALMCRNLKSVGRRTEQDYKVEELQRIYYSDPAVLALIPVKGNRLR